MNRRHFVASAFSTAALAAVTPRIVRAAAVASPDAFSAFGAEAASGGVAPARARVPRCVVVIDLAGGNDGLNTVVPLDDPLYRTLRPRLGLNAAQTVRLDGARRLHAALAPLLPLWQSGEFAIVEGVGVRGGALAHFRAAQAWRSGSRVDVHQPGDWLERALTARAAAVGLPMNAGRPSDAGYRTTGASGTTDGTTSASGMTGASGMTSASGTASRVGAWRAGGKDMAAQQIPKRRVEIERLPVASSTGSFGDVARRAADALIADDGIRALRLTLPGFDTHHRQGVRHAAALTELAGGIAILQHRLRRAGRWNDVVIMTTTEFGRAAAENGQGGTEHGGAAPQFLLGGRVRGGFHGARPRLEAHGGPLPADVDHRSVLASVLASWWELAPTAVLDDAPAALPGLFRV